MGIDKIEKRLPEEILAFIDEETVKSGVTRQEAVSKLVHAVTAERNGNEIDHLRQEIKALSKLLAMKDDEISYLRSELTSVHKGLSKMADTLASGTRNEPDIDTRLIPVREQISHLSEEFSEFQVTMKTGEPSSYERHIPIIIIGVLAALLVVYLIVSRIS